MRFMMIMLPNVPGIDEENWTPDPEAVTAMGAYNEELAKAGVLLALDGLQSPAKGARVAFAGGKRERDRRSVRRGQGADRRLLDDRSRLQGGGRRVGLALPGGATATRSRFARSSRCRTSRPRCRRPAGSRRIRPRRRARADGPVACRPITRRSKASAERAISRACVRSRRCGGSRRRRLIARLARIVPATSGLAEDMAQDALVAALERWPRSGVPENPGAWLTATAKNRAIDQLRRRRRLESKQERARARARDARRGRGARRSGSCATRTRSRTTCCG